MKIPVTYQKSEQTGTVDHNVFEHVTFIRFIGDPVCGCCGRPMDPWDMWWVNTGECETCLVGLCELIHDHQ